MRSEYIPKVTVFRGRVYPATAIQLHCKVPSCWCLYILTKAPASFPSHQSNVWQCKAGSLCDWVSAQSVLKHGGTTLWFVGEFELFPFQPAQTRDLWPLSASAHKTQAQQSTLKGVIGHSAPQSPEIIVSFGLPSHFCPTLTALCGFRPTLRLVIAQALFTLPLFVPTPLSFSLMLLPVWPHPQVRWEGAPPRLTQNKDQRWAGALSRPEEQSQLFSLH